MSSIMERFNERRRVAEEKLAAELAARTPEQVAAYEAAVAADRVRIEDDRVHYMVVSKRKLEKEIRSHLRKCIPCKAEKYCREACERMDVLLHLEKKLATPYTPAKESQ